MRWEELGKKFETWTIPAERAKNNLEHTVPLAKTAIRILEKIKEQHKLDEIKSNFVFPSDDINSSIRWINKASDRIILDAKISDFTPHDLRRTFTTHLASKKVHERTLKKLLNHTANQSITEKHYNRYPELKEMKKAINDWDKYLNKILKSTLA